MICRLTRFTQMIPTNKVRHYGSLPSVSASTNLCVSASTNLSVYAYANADA